MSARTAILQKIAEIRGESQDKSNAWIGPVIGCILLTIIPLVSIILVRYYKKTDQSSEKEMQVQMGDKTISGSKIILYIQLILLRFNS